MNYDSMDKNELENLYTKIMNMNSINELIENFEMIIDSKKEKGMNIINFNIVQSYVENINLIPIFIKSLIKLDDKEFKEFEDCYDKSPFFINMLKKKLLNLIASNNEERKYNYNVNDINARSLYRKKN